MASLTSWLAGLDEAALADVLTNRPDTLLAPQPRTVTELAHRIGRPDSLAAALQELPIAAAQVAEALLALGGRADLAGLSAFLAPGPDHGAQVAHWLQVLTERAIVWPAGGDRLQIVAGARELFPSPLGLGSPLRDLIADVPVDRLRRMLRTIGVAKPAARRADVVEELCRLLGDAEFVRDLVSTAPPEIARELQAWALEDGSSADGFEPGSFGPDDFDTGYGEFADDDDDYGFGGWDPESYRRRNLAAAWAGERGLAVSRSWSHDAHLPAEVARALRGPDLRARFVPEPPSGQVPNVDASRLGPHAAAAVSRFAELVLALTDRIARTPVPALKSGGIGTRELAKLGKALDCPSADVRLALELCQAVGVLGRTEPGWALTERAETWRAEEPAERMAGLLEAWWHLPSVPTEATDDTGKPIAALTARACGGCRAARHGWLQALAELGEGAAPAPDLLAARAIWRRPFVHLLAQDSLPFASVRAESECLGVVAAGALAPAGRALVDGDAARVRDLLAEALPAANGQALFGPDLTAVVAGTPAAALSRLLDTAGDRESRGAATVWRLTPGSIRRALDEGYSGAALEAELAAIATTALPQPLVYLIRDVGARHGNLRVSAATSVLRSADEALLAQVAADRSLRKLGLRLLAPTVLAADEPAEEVLRALRAAGYLPMPEGESAEVGAGPTVGTPIDRTRPARTPPRARTQTQLPTAAELAATLHAHGLGEDSASGTETILQRLNTRLGLSELRVLAHALDTQGPVAIDYRSQSGGQTHRVISGPQLFGDTILAWCELRADERWFRVDRIQSVVPVG